MERPGTFFFRGGWGGHFGSFSPSAPGAGELPRTFFLPRRVRESLPGTSFLPRWVRERRPGTFSPPRIRDRARVRARLGQHPGVYADLLLNDLVKKLNVALPMLTGKNRNAPLYTFYFRAARPFEVAAGILGPQLETMRGWFPEPKKSTDATLQSIGKGIELAVTKADAAVQAKADAEAAIKVFETTGERFRLVNPQQRPSQGDLRRAGRAEARPPRAVQRLRRLLKSRRT